MEHADCGACRASTAARPPNKAFVGLIAAFWAASLALGVVGARGPDWAVIVVASWAALAASVVLLARRATTWTCAECGSTVSPPVTAAPQPLAGALRGMHARHA